jgi:LmbE family N-acetylglucosaminyl deacetylase
MIREYREIPKTALAIYAHPDDMEISCGATLGIWAKNQCTVYSVICAQGEKALSENQKNPKEVALKRKRESEMAAKVLGINRQFFLDLPDAEFENDKDLRDRLIKVIRATKPDVVLCPDPTAVFFANQYFNHRDHRIVGWAALDSLNLAALYNYQPNLGEGFFVKCALLSASLEPNAVVDIKDALKLKAEAIKCHASRFHEEDEWLSERLKERATQAAFGTSLSFGEAFRKIDFIT